MKKLFLILILSLLSVSVGYAQTTSPIVPQNKIQQKTINIKTLSHALIGSKAIRVEYPIYNYIIEFSRAGVDLNNKSNVSSLPVQINIPSKRVHFLLNNDSIMTIRTISPGFRVSHIITEKDLDILEEILKILLNFKPEPDGEESLLIKDWLMPFSQAYTPIPLLPPTPENREAPRTTVPTKEMPIS